MKEVREIILENLGVTCKVINVYDNYKFLIDERERVLEFLE